ncbi:hypothetical protein Tco_0212731 [Tanacetum coccineum]
MVLYASAAKILVEDTLKQKDSDDEPPIKKLKFLIPTSSIPSPTPLNSIPPEPIPRTEIAKMSFDQFSEHLTQTTSSIFSPTPPREPTPPRDESKVKGIATEEPLKDIMPYIEEGGYVPKMPKFKSFITLDEQLTQEDIIAQVKEMKRLADLKSEKEKLEESLKRIRADELPITKINCRVSSSNDATMRITRGNDPLNVVIHDKFRLKTLRFSEWLEVISQAKKLGVPPPPELSTFGILADDKKIKRSSEILQEVFAKENIVVDVMHRNLVPPPGVEGRKGLVIKEPKLGVFSYNGNFDLVFQREEEFHLGTTPQLVRLQNGIIRGTPEAKEFFKKLKFTIEARNDANQARKIVQYNLDVMGQHICIQVKDIIKEVKDYLKTYSSAGMDISWYVEGIHCGSKESQRWQCPDYAITL